VYKDITKQKSKHR